MRFIRETNHPPAIICGKLYGTNSAEVVGEQNGRGYFMILRRNFFSTKREFEGYRDTYGDGCIITICSDTRMESVEKAEEIPGFTDVKRYCGVFGQIEEAWTYGLSPSSKVQDFDFCIRWFKSSWPSFAH